MLSLRAAQYRFLSDAYSLMIGSCSFLYDIVIKNVGVKIGRRIVVESS